MAVLEVLRTSRVSVEKAGGLTPSRTIRSKLNQNKKNLLAKRTETLQKKYSQPKQKGMKKASEFRRVLEKKGYAFEQEGTTIKVTEEGSVYLRSLTTLPDGIQFNNQGYVDLSSLCPDSINAGNENRNLFVVLQKGELKIKLGCFWGTEKEAVIAIAKAYSGKSAKEYIEKVQSAFAKATLRYSSVLTKSN